MKIFVPDIPEEGLDIELAEDMVVEPFNLLSPVRSSLRIERVNSEVTVQGGIDVSIELQCSRCLIKFPQNFVQNVNLEYRPVEEVGDEDKHEIKEDELDISFYKENEIDLAEMITEQIILSVPMKPLCMDACKGICSRCGADLNVNPCSCANEVTSPHFEALKKIWKGEDNGKSDAQAYKVKKR